MGERFFFWLAMMVEVGPIGPIGSGAGTPKEEA